MEIEIQEATRATPGPVYKPNGLKSPRWHGREISLSPTMPMFSRNYLGLRDITVTHEPLYTPVLADSPTQSTDELFEYGGATLVQCGDCKTTDLLLADITEATREFRWELHRLFCIKRTTRYASCFTSCDALMSIIFAEATGHRVVLTCFIHRAKYLHQPYTSSHVALFSRKTSRFGVANVML